MAYILDACAAIAWMRGEVGAEHVRMRVMKSPCAIHAVNLCEVYYDTLRFLGEERANRARREVISGGVKIVNTMSWQFLQLAGELKVNFRMSLADTFVAALALSSNSVVLTSDRKEFSPLLERSICKVEFIR